MPPIRLKLRDLPRVPDGQGDDSGNVNKNGQAAAAPQQRSSAVGAGIAARTAEHLSDAWRAWPVTTVASAHATVKGWFKRMDAALLALPRGLGPAMSSLIRVLTLAIAATILTSIISRTTSNLLKLPSRAKAVGDSSSYTPGKHNWVAAPSRWDPHYCGVCSEAIAWNSDSGVRCQVCGSHAHMSCSKRAHKEGLGCKALCKADVELSHKRLYQPLEEDEDGDEDACYVGLEPEEKPRPIMRHQWMRGSIDDSQPCSGCGGSCHGSGATGQHGFSCAWCKLQVHEGCISRVSHTECSLGRHRRLILPPIAVLKDQPRRKRGLIRDAVSKVRSVLPGARDDECEPPLCIDPDDPEAAGESAGAAASAEGAGGAGGAGEQGTSFVEAVREAAAALDVSGAKEVGSRLAEKVRDARLDVAAGLDVAGDSAKEGGRRLAEKMLDAMPIELEDEVWEVALGGSTGGEKDEDGDGVGSGDGSGGEDVSRGGKAFPAGSLASSRAGIDRVWQAALSPAEDEGEKVDVGDGEGEDERAAETTTIGLAGGKKTSIVGGGGGGGGGEGKTLRQTPSTAAARAALQKAAGRAEAAATVAAAAAAEEGAEAATAAGAGANRVDDPERGERPGDVGSPNAVVTGAYDEDGVVGTGGEGGEGDAAATEVNFSASRDTPPPSPQETPGTSSEAGRGADGSISEEARETILSEFVAMEGGVLRSPDGSDVDDGTVAVTDIDGGNIGNRGDGSAAFGASGREGEGSGVPTGRDNADSGHLSAKEKEEEAFGAAIAGSAGDGDETGQGLTADAAAAGSQGEESLDDQKLEYREVAGVGVAGWARDGAGGGEGVNGEQQRGESFVEGNEEDEEEEDEEEEQEWVVKMQELQAKLQSSGEGPDATKTVTYTRKTRSVTLSICEENIPDDSCPLVVFVNSKSGGKQGGVLLSRFRALLNPLQVVDLSQEDPLEVLYRFRNVANLRLLACGGDGTVAWLLQSVDSITWKVKRPPLAILPLGTGNDLARVLGWGGGYTGEDLENLLDTIENAQVTMLDRWSVSVVTTSKGGFRKSQKDRQLIMNNYLGIGVDGQVALDFHKMREARPVLFFNRLFNKAVYAQLGVRSALVRACHDLPSRIELRCDGKLVPLPQTTASIIACNINSYGGGSKLWAVEERNRRAWAGRTSNHPLSYPQAQQQKTTMWGFDTSGLVNPGGTLSSSARAAAGGATSASPDDESASPPRGGGEGVENGLRRENEGGAAGATTRLRRLRTRLVGAGGGEGSAGVGRSAGPPPLSAVAAPGDPAATSAAAGPGTAGTEGAPRWGGWGVGVSGGESSSDEEEGRWESPRDSRGSSSKKRESKTSFHDGVLEVVAVEGVLHLGQIQLGLSRALAVAQCREMQVKTLATLPMQVDGEPWKQPPSEITVQLHNQAAMLRPATITERAVASVLNDVSSAIHGAEEDLVINERQARTLLSRIRRSTRLPE